MQNPDIINAGTDGAVPDGFTRTEAGLLVPNGTQEFEREDWPSAKVEWLRLAGKFVASRGVAFGLACEDKRCAHDPILRRIEIPNADGAFVLACHHKLRVCADERTKRRLIRNARKAGERHRAPRRKSKRR